MSTIQRLSSLCIKIIGLLVFLCADLCYGQQAWSSVASGTGNDLNSVVWQSWFVAVGNTGTILTSFNGWATTNSGTTADLVSVADNYTLNGYLYVAASPGTILTSRDSFTWFTKFSGIKDSLTSVAPYGSGFVAVGNGVILTSTDATDSTTWIIRDSGTATKGLNSVTYDYPAGFGLLAVGRGGKILTSRDGATWTIRNSGTTNNLNSIIISANVILAVGDSGTILTSTDDSTWTKVNSGTTKRLNSVASGLGLFVAAGDSGTILTSWGAKSWTKADSRTTKRLNSVTYRDPNLIAVGDSGTILQCHFTDGVVQKSSNKSTGKRIKISLANSRLCATLPYATASDQMKVEFFTISGRCIYSATTEPSHGTISIPTSGFPAGMYYLSITNGGRSVVSRAVTFTR